MDAARARAMAALRDFDCAKQTSPAPVAKAESRDGDHSRAPREPLVAAPPSPPNLPLGSPVAKEPAVVAKEPEAPPDGLPCVLEAQLLDDEAAGEKPAESSVAAALETLLVDELADAPAPAEKKRKIEDLATADELLQSVPLTAPADWAATFDDVLQDAILDDCDWAVLEDEEESSLEVVLQSLTSIKTIDGEEGKRKVLVALAALRNETVSEKYRERVFELLSRFRSSSDRFVQQAVRSVRLKWLNNDSDDTVKRQLAAARQQAESVTSKQRALRQSFNEAKKAWHKERIKLQDDLARAERKAEAQIDKLRRALDAAEKDKLALQQQRKLCPKCRAASNGGASPVATTAHERAQQRSLLGTMKQGVRASGATVGAAKKRAAPRTTPSSSAALPACARLVAARTTASPSPEPV